MLCLLPLRPHLQQNGFDAVPLEGGSSSYNLLAYLSAAASDHSWSDVSFVCHSIPSDDTINMGVTFPLERAEQITVFAVAVVFAVLSVLAVALRLLSRQKLGRWLDASDYLMIASCVRDTIIKHTLK